MQLMCATASRQEIQDGFVVEISFCWLLLHSWRDWFTCQYFWKLKLSTYLHIPSGMDCTDASSQCGYSYLWLLTPAFVTCSTNVKGWRPKTKYCHPARYCNPLLLRSLVEKRSMKFYILWQSSITIVRSYTRNISPNCNNLALLIVQCTSNNTIATNSSGIALYYGDTYIAYQQHEVICTLIKDISVYVSQTGTEVVHHATHFYGPYPMMTSYENFYE